MEPEACVFCQKIEAGGDEILNHGPNTVSFEPLAPVTPGHRLFVPVSHVEHWDNPFSATDPSTALGMAMIAAHRWSRESNETEFNLITSSGEAATQTIDHVHVHFVPRRVDDGLPLPWTPQQMQAQEQRAMDDLEDDGVVSAACTQCTWGTFGPRSQAVADRHSARTGHVTNVVHRG